MLIASDRHTDEDLRVWESWEWHDNRVSQSRLAALAERSAAALRLFAERPCYAGVSWGKDSVVLGHLVALHAPHVPLVYMRWQRANPDCLFVRDAFLLAHPGVIYDEIESPEQTGSGFELAVARYGKRHVSGVRAQESRARALRCRRWGESTADTCAPLAWWTVEDVFGCLAQAGLPVHPAYACSYGGTLRRDEIRVDRIGGDEGTGRGRREWERCYYPDVRP
jgi:phosphoadenosine phosphosulfate reductase